MGLVWADYKAVWRNKLLNGLVSVGRLVTQHLCETMGHCFSKENGKLLVATSRVEHFKCQWVPGKRKVQCLDLRFDRSLRRSHTCPTEMSNPGWNSPSQIFSPGEETWAASWMAFILAVLSSGKVGDTPDVRGRRDFQESLELSMCTWKSFRVKPLTCPTMSL